MFLASSVWQRYHCHYAAKQVPQTNIIALIPECLHQYEYMTDKPKVARDFLEDYEFKIFLINSLNYQNISPNYKICMKFTML